MISTVTNENCFEFRGLSTDTKPIGKGLSNANVDYYISNGSIFFEMNTSDCYMFSITPEVVNEKTTYKGAWIKL